VVATDPAETLARDGRKAAWFYARFGLTEAHFRQGVRSDDSLCSAKTEIDYSGRRGPV
jgi:hypothetical protein